MSTASQRSEVQAGWMVVVTGHAVGDAARSGQIVEVLGGSPHPHYRVRWDDGHESLFFPGSDAVIRAPAAPADL